MQTGRTTRRVLAATATAVLALGLSACGQQDQRAASDICDGYQQLQTQADQLRSMDLRTAKASDIVARADRALGELDRLQAGAEGQYDTLFSTVRTAVTNIR